MSHSSFIYSSYTILLQYPLHLVSARALLPAPLYPTSLKHPFHATSSYHSLSFLPTLPKQSACVSLRGTSIAPPPRHSLAPTHAPPHLLHATLSTRPTNLRPVHPHAHTPTLRNGLDNDTLAEASIPRRLPPFRTKRKSNCSSQSVEESALKMATDANEPTRCRHASEVMSLSSCSVNDMLLMRFK